jgi:hypothetical protein
MDGAFRAVTEAGRERRLQLVRRYLDHLQALGEPFPFSDRMSSPPSTAEERSVFRWTANAGKKWVAPENVSLVR